MLLLVLPSGLCENGFLHFSDLSIRPPSHQSMQTLGEREMCTKPTRRGEESAIFSWWKMCTETHSVNLELEMTEIYSVKST